ncbi:lipoprotein insertase outer membrane protein LolB [Halorhodospira halophila]|uniref:Outer-membrane lipoprotein LolB n=1 Tax=Halorhodospira halophila (strain DSM 244 / SL1) TaxID=349124 RepID=LOLB_HALHL|nr:lipoprotein insertase outer membrane protein LolB [Halorhodospira halophila]A1WVQ5.1 RecName: Full=Outer-membrane lipoprotein LolB; Flags: Precursor [Halorhodospira halophila SL1]ABM61767.1 outer membrane lipoprotein LolB [Halorhodospira halophila SL1]
MTGRWSPRLLAGLLAALVLSGCALLVPEDEREAQYEAFLEERAELRDWSVAGRAALRAEGEAVSLSLRWEQRGEVYTINLSGPFGAGAVRIEGQPGRVTLRDGAGQSATAQSPEELLAAQTGHQLPVTALRDWIVGRPADGLEVDELSLDRVGRPDRLEQAGWRVDFQGWTDVDGVDLPSRVDLTRGSTQMRVALSGWSRSDD